MNGVAGLQIAGLQATGRAAGGPAAVASAPEDFRRVLQEKLDMSISKHAFRRFESRDIRLSDGEIEKLNHAAEKARSKGARDSLILLDRMAFVVNVQSKTMVTAMTRESVKDNVFTNIDSTVIA